MRTLILLLAVACFAQRLPVTTRVPVTARIPVGAASGGGSPAFSALPVQSTTCYNAGGGGQNTLTCPVSAIGSGHLLVVLAKEGGYGDYLSGVSCSPTCGTWVFPAGCQGSNAGLQQYLSCAYVLSSSAGATSITLTYNLAAALYMSAAIYEYSYSGGAASYGSSAATTNTGNWGTVNPTQLVATLSGGTNYIVFQSALSEDPPTAISGPYGQFLTPASGEWGWGTAVSVNTVSGTAPTWTMDDTHQVFNNLAFLLPIALSATVHPIMLTSQTGNTQTNRPTSVFVTFQKGDIPHYAQAVIGGSAVTTQCDVKTRWPDSSVKQAMVSFVASPTTSGLSVAFQDQATGNNTGYLTKAAALALSWDAKIQTVASSITKSADARTILNAASSISTDPNSLGVRYWLLGSVVTQIIIEDRSSSRVNDFGYTCSTNCTGTYGTATWTSDTVNRSLHPIFVLTFWAGDTSDVKVDYILENEWTTALQDQAYALTLLGDSGNVTTKFSATFAQYAYTNWRLTYWSGAPIGDIKVDHNFTYMTATGMVPNYDPNATVTTGEVSSDLSSFASTDQCLISGGQWNAHGWYDPTMEDGGQTESNYYGLIPLWQARWLYVMSNASVSTSYFNMMLQEAACSGSAPIHMREGATGTYYDSASSVPATGYNISVNARPTMYWLSGVNSPTPLTTLSTSSGWDVISGGGAVSHQPSYTYVPYLLTGDWYDLQELYAWAGLNFVYGSYVNDVNGRHDVWAYLNDESIQFRGEAWGLNSAMHAGASAPDSSPEKAYFTEKVDFNIQINEGRYNVTSGAYPPTDPTCAGYNQSTTTDKWCWGKMTVSQGIYSDGVARYSPLGFLSMDIVSVGALCSGETQDITGNTANQSCMLPWHWYFWYGAMGHGLDLGFPTQGLLQYGAEFYNGSALNAGWNPYLLENYVYVVTADSKAYITTWSAAKALVVNNTRTSWTHPDTDETVASGYVNIAKGVASWAYPYTTASGSGSNAWNNYWSIGIPNTGAGGDVKWDFVPRH